MIENMNVFEFAAKNRIRFAHRGQQPVEELYNMSMKELDEIYKTLNKELKEQNEGSLISASNKAKSNATELLEVKIEIVKHIFADKLTSAKNAEAAADRKAKKQRILEIMANKKDKELEGKSEDELKALLAELG